MNIAETQRIPKQMQIRLQREEGKMEFAGRLLLDDQAFCFAFMQL